MRVDHTAYQRATRVAGFGFFLQAVIGVVLLVFGLNTGDAGDTAFRFGSYYVLSGLVVWLSLIVVFHQHKLERLEALEEDELAARSESGGSIFDADREEVRVAARRLQNMHRLLLPAVSLLLAALLAFLGWRMWRFMHLLNAPGDEAAFVPEFARTGALGWAVAICLAFAAVSFIFSRFVAGMAKQPAWHNLRGGAGYMVGNALVLLAVATGVIFRFFENERVIEIVCFAIPVFMWLIALEIALNFVLNLYRPRIPGETPRPAFDSRVLGMLAAPDSLVRSINEAVNYQFGFDVTSTWGYQLLMRSIVRLGLLGLIVLVVLSTMVVVEPYQQGLRLAGGRIVGGVHDSGLLWKLPWPLQTAETFDVTRIRELWLTSHRTRFRPAYVWTDKLAEDSNIEPEPFIVRASRFDVSQDTMLESPEDAAEGAVEGLALVNAEIALQYRIADDGLLEYLRFADDAVARRERLNTREKILRDLALAEITRHFSTLTLDEVLARRRDDLAADLGRRVQAAFDRRKAGVQVVALTIPLLRPHQAAVLKFEDLAMASQDLELIVAEAERNAVVTFASLVSDPDRAQPIADEIDTYNRLVASDGRDAPATIGQRDKVEQMIVASGGNAAQTIEQAYTDRWTELLSEQADAVRVRSQIAAFRAAPELYRQREIMRVYREQLGRQRSYIIGIDPGRLNVDVELKELAPVLDFSSVATKEDGS